MRVIKAPGFVPSTARTLFLAGSIEMGAAVNWQEEAASLMTDLLPDWTAVNPRRDDWDSSWKQDISNPQFYEQVMWELDHIDTAEHVLFYFDPATKSPITLMELGYCAAARPQSISVVCPEGFWRKGNVDILCHRCDVPQYAYLRHAITQIGLRS